MSEIIIYRNQDHTMHLEVQFDQDTVWLTQKQMSELFDRGRSTITGHIKNIFEEGEPEEKAVCRYSRLLTFLYRAEGTCESSRKVQFRKQVTTNTTHRHSENHCFSHPPHTAK